MTEEKKQAGAKERSQAILEEQRRLRKEKFLSNPALIIGLVGMVIIVLAALVLPAGIKPTSLTLAGTAGRSTVGV